MRNPLFLTLFILAMPSIGPADEGMREAPPLVLGEGEQRLLRIPGLKKFSFGKDIVRSLKGPGGLGKDQLLIKGVKAGTTDFWVWKENGESEHRTLRVVKWSEGKNGKEEKILQALSPLTEVEIIPTGKGFVLRGQVTHREEAARIQALKLSYPKEVLDQTILEAKYQSTLIEDLKKWIEDRRLQDQLRVESFAHQIWVRGFLEDPSQITRTIEVLRDLFPLVRHELGNPNEEGRTIHITLRLLELQRKHFQQLGIRWPGQVSIGADAFIYDPFSGKAQGQILGKLAEGNLNLESGDGNIRVLSQPELVLKAPGEAELFAGGELPIQQSSRYFSQVEWKNFGLWVKLKVLQLKGERISMEVESRMSHLDPKLSSSDIPGLRSNHLKTQVYAQFGRPLLLSGLLQDQRNERKEGLPLLKDIPILGALFGSKAYIEGRSELVVVLIPHAEAPALYEGLEEDSDFPRGPVPPPRHWLSPDEQIAIKNHKDYPWIALESE